METLIFLLIAIPLVSYFVSLTLSGKSEKTISTWPQITLSLQLLITLTTSVIWFMSKEAPLLTAKYPLYTSGNYSFYLSLFIDRISFTFGLLGSFCSLMIIRYCKIYLHREVNYKRFFSTLQLFSLGYSIVVYSGNMETLFIGWEILGISSFLLIAFYRNRYRPVKNALKIYSVYRIGDVGIILAMWLCHLLFERNVDFQSLNNSIIVQEHLIQHASIGLAMGLLLLITAITKSAQFPFSFWLPKAMEGPTPSSAIFYGAMAVHMGAFLLLRTYGFWSGQLVIKSAIVVIGLITTILCHFSAQTQFTAKSQIAYSSLAQIGLIFIEIGLGWHNIALFHIAGNGLLRCYQLLISPSMVSYKIKEQFYLPKVEIGKDNNWSRIKTTLYLLSLKEWNLEQALEKSIWNPIRKIGRGVERWSKSSKQVTFAISLIVLISLPFIENETIKTILEVTLLLINLIVVIYAFTYKRSAMKNWFFILANQVGLAVLIGMIGQNKMEHIVLYLSGTFLSFCLGYYCLNKHKKIQLFGFQGLSSNAPVESTLFLLACLGISGFPITTTFLGEDVFFTRILAHQWYFACILAINFIVVGLACIRLFARLYLGNKSNQIGAKRSA